MYALSSVAPLVSAISVSLGLAMAHTLYKSPHKPWKCILAWALIFAVCIPVGELFHRLLPQFTQQHIAAFTGCLLVFGYLYVFSDISLPQRIFNYFLVVDFLYIMLLIARTVQMLLVGYFALPADETFLACYLFIAAGSGIFYNLWFRAAILRSLAAFRRNLLGLTCFSCCCYFSSLFLIDAWAPWPALTLRTAMPAIGLLVIKIVGYVLAFHTLTAMGQQSAAESNTKMAQLQLALSVKEYHATMVGIDQVRRMRHDMVHHLAAISALVAQSDTEGAQTYIEKASALLPQRAISDESPITGSFVERYRTLCSDDGIEFTAHMHYREAMFPNAAHLGILLGNSLQNAYEAARQVYGAPRFVSVEGNRVRDTFVLTVKNSFDGARDPHLSSTKGEGHGLGLSNMKNVVDEYGGYLDVSHENGVFTLYLALALPRAAKS